MGHDTFFQDSFEKLYHNTCQRNWSIVGRISFCTFFEYGNNSSLSPTNIISARPYIPSATFAILPGGKSGDWWTSIDFLCSVSYLPRPPFHLPDSPSRIPCPSFCFLCQQFHFPPQGSSSRLLPVFCLFSSCLLCVSRLLCVRETGSKYF